MSEEAVGLAILKKELEGDGSRAHGSRLKYQFLFIFDGSKMHEISRNKDI